MTNAEARLSRQACTPALTVVVLLSHKCSAFCRERALLLKKLVCLLLGNDTKEYLINEVCFPLGITASFDQSPLEIALGSTDVLCNSSLA